LANSSSQGGLLSVAISKKLKNKNIFLLTLQNIHRKKKGKRSWREFTVFVAKG
jgi:hypothetical protein